jgi:hypothetical protein
MVVRHASRGQESGAPVACVRRSGRISLAETIVCLAGTLVRRTVTHDGRRIVGAERERASHVAPRARGLAVRAGRRGVGAVLLVGEAERVAELVNGVRLDAVLERVRATASLAAVELQRREVQDHPTRAIAEGNAEGRDENRGKRLCAPGVLIEIAVEKASSTKKAASGLLMSDAGNLFRFYALGSSGELVAQSRARLCGVVTGRFDYSNSAGGTGHAVKIVGMFDLPENH